MQSYIDSRVCFLCLIHSDRVVIQPGRVGIVAAGVVKVGRDLVVAAQRPVGVAEAGQHLVVGISRIETIGPHVDVRVIGGRHQADGINPTVVKGIVFEGKTFTVRLD